MKWLISKINTWSSSLSSERVLHMTGVAVNALVVCFRRDIVSNPWQKRHWVNNSSHYWLQLEDNTKKTVTTFCIAWYLCIVTHTITHYISWLKIYLCVGKGFGSFCEHVSVVELMGQLVILYMFQRSNVQIFPPANLFMNNYVELCKINNIIQYSTFYREQKYCTCFAHGIA